MKQVINGGISTTTVPYYTKDALLLAMQDEKLAGVSLNIYHTKDQKLVPTFAVTNKSNCTLAQLDTEFFYVNLFAFLCCIRQCTYGIIYS